MVSVPKAWPGETVVVIATGPSLTAEDVDYCRGKARVIVVNDAYTLAPWADALYATDAKWWTWHHGVPEFTGAKWSLEHSQWNNTRAKYTDVQRLRNTGANALEHSPTGLRNGRNSGFAAINLAVHYGAQKIVLLGYDMQPVGGKSHFFGEHPNKQKSPYPQFRANFVTLVKPLAKMGIEIVNCSVNSALTCFPKADLREALKEPATRDAHMAVRLPPYTVEQVGLSGGQAGQAADTAFGLRLPSAATDSHAQTCVEDTPA